MHVRTKHLSLAGLLLAISILFVMLGSFIESSTLFFLAAASFCLGIVICETGLLMGFCFMAAALALSFFLSPTKTYCLTYGAFLTYIFFIECIQRKTKLAGNRTAFTIIKLLIFNLLYLLPALIFFPALLFTGYKGHLSIPMCIGIFVAGQIVLYVFDEVYKRFMRTFWPGLRSRLHLHS